MCTKDELKTQIWSVQWTAMFLQQHRKAQVENLTEFMQASSSSVDTSVQMNK